ncbi:type II toxin-antitoxin system ParD family antitoxin [Methyloraptor flagellatus]|jgi:antitoxin ParD1/3/4|uniref:Type II toxin-antitoxin system ParD family antitoxin n=1 Tax=Methyloraptor flagellatus TaxID=3162530 RepID=A0AAU7XG06_9HYPH
MATMTISLPDPLKDWVEAQVETGDYASASDYVRDLIRRDRARHDHPKLTIEDLRRIVEESLEGPDSVDSVKDVIAEGRRIIAGKGRANG